MGLTRPMRHSKSAVVQPGRDEVKIPACNEIAVAIGFPAPYAAEPQTAEPQVKSLAFPGVKLEFVVKLEPKLVSS
jgi:hypothetical protein